MTAARSMRSKFVLPTCDNSNHPSMLQQLLYTTVCVCVSVIPIALCVCVCVCVSVIPIAVCHCVCVCVYL